MSMAEEKYGRIDASNPKELRALAERRRKKLGAASQLTRALDGAADEIERLQAVVAQVARGALEQPSEQQMNDDS